MEIRSITAKEVAVLVRRRLKSEFPGVWFRVRSQYNAVDIFWTDGPTDRRVYKVVSAFSFGGFDPTIDLAYVNKNWLLPDGTMSPAHSAGTADSRGSVSGFSCDKPHPDAELVQYGPRYISTHRDISPAVMMAAAVAASEYYGFSFDHNKRLGDQRIEVMHDYLDQIAWRWDSEHN